MHRLVSFAETLEALPADGRVEELVAQGFEPLVGAWWVREGGLVIEGDEEDPDDSDFPFCWLRSADGRVLAEVGEMVTLFTLLESGVLVRSPRDGTSDADVLEPLAGLYQRDVEEPLVQGHLEHVAEAVAAEGSPPLVFAADPASVVLVKRLATLLAMRAFTWHMEDTTFPAASAEEREEERRAARLSVAALARLEAEPAPEGHFEDWVDPVVDALSVRLLAEG
jgi:hypothetical protein